MDLIVKLYCLFLSVFLFAFAVAVKAAIETPTDSIPDFAANPTCTTTQSGNWFSVGIWDCGRVPTTNDVALVDHDHAVVYNGANNDSLTALGIKGTLQFSNTVSTRINVATILVYREGRLNIGTTTNPVPANIVAKIVFSNRPLDTEFDPKQYGNGLIVLGEINVHGAETGETWRRLTAEALAGQNTITLESVPLGWQVGDILVFPDSRQRVIKHKWTINPMELTILNIEERAISAISGNKITLAQPLSFNHKGVRDSGGVLIALPHVANTTRNVIFRSENAGGVRAHGMMTERARVDIRFSSWINMGRTTADPLDNTEVDAYGNVTHIGTNQIGRYPVHLHHHMGPVNAANEGYQAIVSGNAFIDCEKWCVSYHDAHWSLFSNNVLYGATGSSFMTEDGNETANEILDNIAILSGTPFNNYYDPRYGGTAGLDPYRKERWDDFGWEGSCYWLTGNSNILRGNVAATCAYAGIMDNARGASGFGYHYPKVPLHRGADIRNESEWYQYNLEFAPEIIDYSDNEVYASTVGIWNGFSGNVGETKDTLIWHTSQQGIYSQRNNYAKYTNVRLYNDQALSNQNYLPAYTIGVDLFNPRYQSGTVVLEGMHIEGFSLGIDLPAFMQDTNQPIGPVPPRLILVDNSYMRNYTNVADHSPLVGPKNTLLRDVEFERNAGPSNPTLSTVPADIVTSIVPPFSLSTLNEHSRLYVFGYNKVQGDDFKVYFYEQEADYVMSSRDYPAGTPLAGDKHNCPTIGLTNQECSDQHKGVSIMGEIATCNDDTTRQYVDAFTCPKGDTTELDAMLNAMP